MSKPTAEELRIAKKVWDVVFGQEWTVESMDYARKREGTKYTVKQHGDGHWSCDCQSWKFESGTFPVNYTQENGKTETIQRTCKHIRFVMEKEKMRIKRKFGR